MRAFFIAKIKIVNKRLIEKIKTNVGTNLLVRRRKASEIKQKMKKCKYK